MNSVVQSEDACIAFSCVAFELFEFGVGDGASVLLAYKVEWFSSGSSSRPYVFGMA